MALINGGRASAQQHYLFFLDDDTATMPEPTHFGWYAMLKWIINESWISFCLCRIQWRDPSLGPVSAVVWAICYH